MSWPTRGSGPASAQSPHLLPRSITSKDTDSAEFAKAMRTSARCDCTMSRQATDHWSSYCTGFPSFGAPRLSNRDGSLTTSVKPQIQTNNGLKIRFAESAQRDDHALLLRPWAGGSADLIGRRLQSGLAQCPERRAQLFGKQ
jgi:hypothetical protein